MRRANLSALMSLALGAALSEDKAAPRRRSSQGGMQLPLEPRVSPEEAEKVRQELRARRVDNFKKQKKL